jgi:hypothetical protein
MRPGRAAAWLIAFAASPALAAPAPATPTFAPAPPATPLAPAASPPAPAPEPAAAADERAAAIAPAAPSPAEPLPPPAFAPPPPFPLAPPRRRLYGDTGSMELALAIGYTQQSGFVGGGGFRRFVADGVGPGLEATIQKTDGLTAGLLLASLKLVPFRGDGAALVITGRGGRVLLSDHQDGWGAGVGAGVILFFSPGVGLELGYSVLWLLPARFCADLVSCEIRGPELGLRVMF